MTSSSKGGSLTVADSNAPVISQAGSSISGRDPSTAPERGGWGNQVEFVLTCIGFAVGLGNVWRFPYLCYANGGGAFLIPYFIVMIFVGLPMYFMELSFGQFSGRGPLTVWVVNPMFKGVGIAMQIVAAYIVCYYNVIVTWCLYYFFASMNKNLPWELCGNWWNTDACIDRTMNLSSVVDENGTINGSLPTTPSEEYYYNKVLQLSSGIDEAGTVVWQLALLLGVAWIIIFLVLLKGVASVGKVSYFVSLFPYVLLTVLLGQAAVMDGALDGVKFYLTPQWDRLLDAQAWGDAAAQIFYSLGICMGSLIAMASFNPFHNNCRRDSILIPIINCLTSFYAGFVVFTMLGYIAKEKNLDIKDVAQDGPGLVFVIYPEGLATLPVAPLWATLFFFMMCTLGFSSQFSMAEGICAAIVDEYPILLRRRNGLLLRAGYCVANYLLGLPMVTEGGFYIFNLMNNYCAGYTLMFCAIFEIMAIAWIYDFRRFSEDIKIMLGTKPNGFWIGCWVGITPILILAVVIFTIINQSSLSFGDYIYPDFAQALAWLVVAFPIVMTFGWMIGYLCYAGGDKVCRNINRPQELWGPPAGHDKDDISMTSSSSSSSTNSDDIERFPEKPGVFSVDEKLSPPPAYNGLSKDMTSSFGMGIPDNGHLNTGFNAGEDDIMVPLESIQL